MAVWTAMDKIFYIPSLSEQLQFGGTPGERDDSAFLTHRLQSEFECTFVVQGDGDFIFENVLPNPRRSVGQIHGKFSEHSFDFRVLYAKNGLLIPAPSSVYSGHAVAFVYVQCREVELRFVLGE